MKTLFIIGVIALSIVGLGSAMLMYYTAGCSTEYLRFRFSTFYRSMRKESGCYGKFTKKDRRAFMVALSLVTVIYFTIGLPFIGANAIVNIVDEIESIIYKNSFRKN